MSDAKARLGRGDGVQTPLLASAAADSRWRSRQRVVVLGLGHMGAAMAQRLSASGLEVGLYNRSSQRADEVAKATGGRVLPTPAAAARWAAESHGVLLTSLSDDSACRAVYLGIDGLAESLQSGAVVCDTSTISPETARELADAVAKRGAAFLNSPVSGSVPSALSGGLTVMVGGDAQALESARPVLETIGSKVVHVGGPGAGAAVKLGVNSILHTLNQAISEAIVLVEKAGVDPSVFYDVIADSAVAAPFVGYKRDAFLHPATAPVAFGIELMAKDLGLIRSLAQAVGAPMPGAEVVSEVAQQAISHGYRGADMSAVARYLREL